MGKRGPKPQPTELKKARGNPGRRKLPKSEPKPKAGKPRCPSWLGPVGKRYWKDALDNLPGGVVTLADGALLSQYASAWEDFHQARLILKQEGEVAFSEKGAPYQHPAVGIKNKASERIRRFAALFGLSPADRVGLSLQTDSEEVDPLLDMLKRRASNN